MEHGQHHLPAKLSVGSRVRMVGSVSDQMPARVRMAGWVVSVKNQYAFCHVSTEVAVWLLTSVTALLDGLEHDAIQLFASRLV